MAEHAHHLGVGFFLALGGLLVLLAFRFWFGRAK